MNVIDNNKERDSPEFGAGYYPISNIMIPVRSERIFFRYDIFNI